MLEEGLVQERGIAGRGARFGGPCSGEEQVGPMSSDPTPHYLHSLFVPQFPLL